MSSVAQVAEQCWLNYARETSQRLRLLDLYILFCVGVALVQVGYSLLAGRFPMNSLLSGVAVAGGSAVITLCLRLQLDPRTKYVVISQSRALWEYLFCMLLLFTAGINYLG